MTAAPSTKEVAKEPRPGLGRPFAALLTSTGLANLGDGILGTLAPLVALSLTTSPLQISLLSAATWLPWLLFGIAAGVVIDRVDRRRAQVVALSVRAGVLATGAALGFTGALTMPLLVCLVLAYGATEVFADLGATSIVPDLVPPDRFSAANGRVIAVQQVANAVLGAPLAGVLVVLGAGIGFGTSAALAALAAVVLAVGLRGSFRPRAVEGSAESTLGQVREGLAFLVRHPVMRPLVISSSVLNLASTAYFAVFVLWAVGPGSAMRLTESQYPLVMLGFALGAVAGSFLADPVQRWLGVMPTILGTLVASVLLLLVPVLWPNGWAVAAAVTLVGITNTIGNVVSQSLRQRLVPGALLGRVGGASRTLGFGLMPVGALLGGLVAERAGLTATFLAAVGLSLVACVYLGVTVRPSDIRAAEANGVRP
ncbi:MAG TPA: MFS transporter [Propionicimonas sp.]|nr:MFS transporter [Propionicimonas sp.]